MSSHKTSIAVMVLCAVSDLVAVPLLLGDDDLAPFGVAVAVLGVLTLVAAYGLAVRAGWARPVALGTRAVDAVAAVPALFVGAGAAETAAASVTVALSLVAIALVLRVDRSAVRTA